jgi:nicotinamidase-related amidase
MITERFVSADPYPWPYNGDLRPQNTAVLVIDMQTDFCGIGGYVDISKHVGHVNGYSSVIDEMAA